jgi:hypothetical protein
MKENDKGRQFRVTKEGVKLTMHKMAGGKLSPVASISLPTDAIVTYLGTRSCDSAGGAREHFFAYGDFTGVLTKSVKSVPADDVVYTRAHFSIETKGYKWGIGVSGDRAAQSLKEEVRKILAGLGFTWKDQPLHDMAEARRGCEYLYCHTNSLMGWLDAESIPAIRQALEKAATFTVTALETFAQVRKYTPEEHGEVLGDKREGPASRLIGKFADTLVLGNGDAVVVSPFVDRMYHGQSEVHAGRAA